ncbi:hypothetical protein LOAG_02934, partial [Loa loa]
AVTNSTLSVIVTPLPKRANINYNDQAQHIFALHIPFHLTINTRNSYVIYVYLLPKGIDSHNTNALPMTFTQSGQKCVYTTHNVLQQKEDEMIYDYKSNVI